MENCKGSQNGYDLIMPMFASYAKGNTSVYERNAVILSLDSTLVRVSAC